MIPQVITAAERAARRSQWKGLGDVVASATKLLGVRPCAPCNRRRESLNRAIQFKIASR